MRQARIYDLFSKYPELMTVKEVAAAARCSRSFICSLIQTNRLPCFCIGSHYRIKRDDAVVCFSGNSVFYPELGGE